MRATLTLTMVALATLAGRTLAQSPGRLNSVIQLLEHRQAVFGVYAPSNRRAGANGTPAARTPVQLAQDGSPPCASRPTGAAARRTWVRHRPIGA